MLTFDENWKCLHASQVVSMKTYTSRNVCMFYAVRFSRMCSRLRSTCRADTNGRPTDGASPIVWRCFRNNRVDRTEQVKFVANRTTVSRFDRCLAG